MNDRPPANGSPEAPVSSPPAFRLLGTLGLAGALSGLLLVMVHTWTQPRILAHQARVLREAIHEVLGGPERYETLFILDGQLQTQLPAGTDSTELDRIYLGYDADGRALGYAIAGAEPGFQDVISLLFGFDPSRGQVMGMKVLDHRETPGLGDKIEKDSTWLARFAGVEVPLLGVKANRSSGARGEVDMITGATISSRAVIQIINHRLEELQPVLNTDLAARVATPTGAPGGR